MQYGYTLMAGGVNHSRLTAMTYPNGKVLTFNYSAGVNDAISRLSLLSDTTGTLESYDYLGLGAVVRRAHPQPGVDLAYIKQSGEPNGGAGDQYAGLDRFGRVEDQRWLKVSTGVATDRHKYGYDRNSNRLWRDNLVNAAFGELYAYDGLNQITSFQRGTLNATKDGLVGSPSRSQSWAFDALGNWNSVTTDGAVQTRNHDRQNQITSVSGATPPTYDANGNLTRDETGKTFVYDAWNRLVEVKDAGGATLVRHGYDALGRRVTETRSGTTTDLYYSVAWQVLEERVGGVAKSQYVWSPVYVDALVLRDRDANGDGTLEERLWVQQDANWNVTALVDSAGNVVERYAYDAFGQATVLSATWVVLGGSAYGWVYQFQGLRLDAAAGLSHARRRELTAAQGRWLQLDRIRLKAGDPNFYRFVSNAPTRYTDPSGRIFVEAFQNVYIEFADGITPKTFTCPNDNPKFNDGKTVLGTIRDSQGNTLEVYCAGDSFKGKLTINRKSTPFGKCIARAGINTYSFEFNKDGTIKEIRWFNIGPIKGGRDALVDELRQLLKKAGRDTTCSQDQKGITDALEKQQSNINPSDKGKQPGGDLFRYDVVMYTWPEMKVYRLYYDTKNKKFVWIEDKETPLGAK